MHTILGDRFVSGNDGFMLELAALILVKARHPLPPDQKGNESSSESLCGRRSDSSLQLPRLDAHMSIQKEASHLEREREK